MPDLGVDSDLDELDSIMIGTVKVSPITIKCKEISRTMTKKPHVEDSQPYSVLKSCKDMSTYCSQIRWTFIHTLQVTHIPKNIDQAFSKQKVQ